MLRALPLGFVLLALVPASAAAVAPSLDSVGYSSNGQPTAELTLLGDEEFGVVEVAVAPDLDPDGSFVDANVVQSEPDADLFEEYWKGEDALPPGTYYVHVGVETTLPCEDPEDFDAPPCVEPILTEWSNVLVLVVPPPVPGRYTGKTDFGERVTFVLSKDSRSITGLTADFDIVCTRASGVFRLKFPTLAVSGRKFKRTVKVKFAGGGAINFKVTGVLTLTGRASGRLDAKGSIRGVGKCKDFGNPEWSARKRS